MPPVVRTRHEIGDRIRGLRRRRTEGGGHIVGDRAALPINPLGADSLRLECAHRGGRRPTQRNPDRACRLVDHNRNGRGGVADRVAGADAVKPLRADTLSKTDRGQDLVSGEADPFRGKHIRQRDTARALRTDHVHHRILRQQNRDEGALGTTDTDIAAHCRPVPDLPGAQ